MKEKKLYAGIAVLAFIAIIIILIAVSLPGLQKSNSCSSDSECTSYALCTAPGSGFGQPGECKNGQCQTSLIQTCVEACGAECGNGMPECSEGKDCNACFCKEKTELSNYCETVEDCEFCQPSEIGGESAETPFKAGIECKDNTCTGTLEPAYCSKECGAECESNSDCETGYCDNDVEQGTCKCIEEEPAGCTASDECKTDEDCLAGQECDNELPLGTCTCIEKEVPGPAVGLSTNKDVYGMGETVTIKLTNNLDQQICYFAYGLTNCNKHPFTVNWLFQGNWQEFTTFEPGKLCSMDNEPYHCYEVPAKDSIELSWGQTFYHHVEEEPFKPVPEGTYKMVMKYKRDLEQEDWYEIESKEFEIKY
ncbi:hypothetical protein K8R43_00985 [archaeon]|nr:hypothetical protein [archaeon]